MSKEKLHQHNVPPVPLSGQRLSHSAKLSKTFKIPVQHANCTFLTFFPVAVSLSFVVLIENNQKNQKYLFLENYFVTFPARCDVKKKECLTTFFTKSSPKNICIYSVKPFRMLQIAIFNCILCGADTSFFLYPRPRLQ